MTKAIAGAVIIAAAAYVAMRLTFWVAALVITKRDAERERDRLARDRMPQVQDVPRRHRRDGEP